MPLVRLSAESSLRIVTVHESYSLNVQPIMHNTVRSGPKKRPAKGWSGVPLSLCLSPVWLDKRYRRKENNEELKVNCPCHNLSVFWVKIVACVLGRPLIGQEIK